MKKTLIAGAVLGLFAGIAAAQSSVTLYGRLDAGYGKRYGDAKANMQSNYKDTSMWGLRGSEDLGDGLRANFNLESEINSVETGNGPAATGGGLSFNRAAWVGLSGSNWGAASIGRMTTPQNRVMGTFDLNGGSTQQSSALGALGLGANSSLGGSRQNSMLNYTSPNFGGFSAQVGYALKADRPAAAGAAANKDFVQAAGSYKNGGLTLGAVVQSKLSESADARTGYALGAKYDFKSVVVSGLYTQDESKVGGRGFGFGVAVPLGLTTVGAQVARLSKSATTANEGAMAYELFANYNLSKRTLAYVAYGHLNDKAKVVNKAVNSNTLGVGLMHTF